MKIIPLFLLTSALAFAGIDLNSPLKELALTDGRTLTNVSFISYSPTTIMAKWDGGRGTISYDVLPAPVAEAVKPMRPKAAQPPPKAAPVPKTTISGQVFITTRGGASKKLSDQLIEAFPLKAYDHISKTQQNLVPQNFSELSENMKSLELASSWMNAVKKEKAVGHATTDSDGNYSMEIPAGTDVFLLCVSARELPGSVETSIWAIPVTKDKLNLSSSNEWISPYR